MTVHDVTELDPATPCIAVSYVGSTLLLEERLPDEASFAEAIAAVGRWLGSPATAVCTLEAAGLNALTALHLADTHQVVDADCMGRALPGLDQLSLLIDQVPGLVACVPTGSGGVALPARRPPLGRRAGAALRPGVAAAGPAWSSAASPWATWPPTP